MRIGILGGTFNPIHIGHIRGAISTYETFLLDKMIFLPTGIPPHKKDDVANAEYRYEMIRLTIEELDFCDVSRYEIDLNRVNYTIDSVRHFRKLYPNNELFFIVGTDAFYYLSSWKQYRELIELITFIVVRRPEYETSIILNKYKNVVDFKEIESKERYRAEPRRVYIYTPPAFDVSSSMIRDKIKKGECIKYLVPEKVEKFIFEKGLYR